jgi:hypothetical protein
MLINSKDILFGQPVLKIREVIRNAMQEKLWGSSQAVVTDKVANILKQPNSVAKQLVEHLKQEDYLSLKKEKFGTKIQYELTVTEKGRRFGLATATSPISRQKATKLLNELIERAKTINSNDELAYVVESIKVFGSYLSDNDLLGDLDVGYKLIRRYTGDEFSVHNQKRIDYAKSTGKSFSSFVDEIFWPHKEVMLMLKNRQKGLSLHNEETDRVIEVTITKLVYQYNKSIT